MKISNFEFTRRKGSGPIDWEFYATVNVSQLFGLIKARKDIRKEYGGYWYFTDTGKFAPGFQVEELVRAYEARYGKLVEIESPSPEGLD